MGGRGQNYSIVKRLPNFKCAIVPRNKLKNYILNPGKSPDKAKFFASIGYNMRNWERFMADVKKKVRTNKALKYRTDKYGQTEYQVNMQIGITRKRMVATGWVVRKGSSKPQFVTAYQNKKLEGKSGLNE
ncbi:DUF6883 domain-containing protein [Acidaminococcus sp.]|uniref:DUF6883 domain-containing protein n=1 Tax=Acidaminococcus sp. TaxID=1872103 RepID=UPI003D7E03BA